VAPAIGATGEAAIEDLFSDDYYLDRVHEVYGKQLKAIGVDRLSLTGQGALEKRVERAMETAGIRFNKGSVAKCIRSELARMANADALPQETRSRGTRLIAAINETMR
jgi:hypothetical protein